MGRLPQAEAVFNLESVKGLKHWSVNIAADPSYFNALTL
jgi:hypothetical protein